MKMRTGRSIALLLGFLVTVAIFGTDYPDEVCSARVMRRTLLGL